MRKIALVVVLVVAVASTAAAGETIRVLIQMGQWAAAMKEMIPEFEKETGIKVNMDIYGEDQLSQKLTVEFTASGGNTVDAFMFRPFQEGRMFYKNGWYTELNPYFENDTDYDINDFTDSSLSSSRYDGIQTGIPLTCEMGVLFYRKDILEAKGIAVPKTFEELEAAAKLLHDPDNEFSGFVARGQRAALITQFSAYLYGFGGDFFDAKTGKSMVDTPEFRKAAEFYGSMLRNYGPPGVQNMTWMQACAIFSQGKAAMYTDASSMYANLLDPTISAVADKTAVAIFPAGPAAHKTYEATSWALAISPGSQHKDATWKFVRYMTSKEAAIISQGKFGNPGGRKSAYLNPAAVANYPATWVAAIAETGKREMGIGYDRPLVTAVGEARDMIGMAVAAAIEGKDIEPVVKQADKRFQELLDRERAND